MWVGGRVQGLGSGAWESMVFGTRALISWGGNQVWGLRLGLQALEFGVLLKVMLKMFHPMTNMVRSGRLFGDGQVDGCYDVERQLMWKDNCRRLGQRCILKEGGTQRQGSQTISALIGFLGLFEHTCSKTFGLSSEARCT